MIELSTPLLLLVALPVLAALVLLFVRHRSRPILRGFALLLVVFALAGPRLSEQLTDRNVVFLVDRSASVTLTTNDEEVRSAIEHIRAGVPDSAIAAIEFAETATLVAPLGSPLVPLGTLPAMDAGSNLDTAVELALSILPERGANQFVLVSDGHFTDDLDIPLDTARIAGVPLSVLPVGTAPPTDIAVISLHAPSLVSLDRPFSIDITVDAARAGDASLVLYRDDELLSYEAVSLDAGLTTFSLQDTLAEPAAHTYQAIIKGSDDPIPANDSLSTLISATGQPPVLVVDAQGQTAVDGLLRSLGIESGQAPSVPPLEVLSSYRQVVLTGRPFAAMSTDEIDALTGFVRHLGGGLLVVQGEEEVRGISEGGIEKLLPVSYSLPEKSREAQLALVYVLDRSSSMRSRVGGVEKIEILKEAAAASAALLDASTNVGIVAFNLEHEWTVPIAAVEPTQLYDALRDLEAIGGTDVFYPIVEALDRLDELEVPAKHILLISDGKTVDEPRNYSGLLRRLREADDVTLSAIGVGQTMNIALLSALVDAGGGTLYRADDFSLLPQISIQATQRISRKRFIDGPVDVGGRLVDQLGTAIPALDGYILTYVKPTADTSLWAGEDPVISTWRLGLGSVTVLNTDLAGRATAAWLAWPDLSALFDRLLATTEPMLESTLGLSPSLVTHEDTIELIIDARDDAGGYANFLDLEVELLPEGRSIEPLQMAPGLYVASFSRPNEGGYALHTIDHTRGRSLTSPLTVPYSSEYRRLGPDRDTLERIASETGGVVLDGDAPLPIVEGGLSTSHTSRHAWLLLAALVVFLLDLAVRKWPRRSGSPP